MTDNLELLRGTYDAFGRGDIPAVMATFADDIDWRVPAVLPHGGHTSGHEGVGAFFQKLSEVWDDFGLELGDFVGSGDRVCVHGQARGTYRGAATGYGFVHSWTVRDGKLARMDEYVDPEPELLG